MERSGFGAEVDGSILAFVGPICSLRPVAVGEESEILTRTVECRRRQSK